MVTGALDYVGEQVVGGAAPCHGIEVSEMAVVLTLAVVLLVAAVALAMTGGSSR